MSAVLNQTNIELDHLEVGLGELLNLLVGRHGYGVSVLVDVRESDGFRGQFEAIFGKRGKGNNAWRTAESHDPGDTVEGEFDLKISLIRQSLHEARIRGARLQMCKGSEGRGSEVQGAWLLSCSCAVSNAQLQGLRVRSDDSTPVKSCKV